MFLLGRLDLILVMNFGGLAQLGKYVAVLTFGETIRTANRFFSDTLLPSLSNTFATADYRGASQLFAVNLRLLFAVTVAGTCALMLLVDPIIALFGSQYLSLKPLFILMLLLYGLSGPGSIGPTLLVSIGKPDRALWINIGQLLIFVVLFAALWPTWQLTGAVLASGSAWALSSVASLVVAKRSAPVSFSAAKDYAKAFVVMAAVALIASRIDSAQVLVRTGTWVAAMLIFLVIAGYNMRECRALLSLVVPSRRERKPGQTVRSGIAAT
jgi:O-antigen/teichoic acid export membrane protein